jgi:hypothetical protein
MASAPTSPVAAPAPTIRITPTPAASSALEPACKYQIGKRINVQICTEVKSVPRTSATIAAASVAASSATTTSRTTAPAKPPTICSATQ